MQTFLPYSSFEETARCLDNRRLGKQRVEAFQILNTLSEPHNGWANHPAVLQWQGYKQALKVYINAMIDEWVRRGYENNMKRYEIDPDTVFYPDWVKDNRLIISHRSNLLRKDPEHYSKFNWKVPAFLEYFWPVRSEKGFHSRETLYTNLEESVALQQLRERNPRMAYYIAYKDLEKKDPEVSVYHENPEKLLTEEHCLITVTSEEDLYDVPGKLQVLLYNKASGKDLQKFSDKKDGARKLFPWLEKLVVPFEKPKKEKAKSKGSETVGDDMIIRLLVEENPKRKNSQAYAYFEVLMSCKDKTVREFREAGRKKFKGYSSTDDVRTDWTSGELRWCLKKGYIQLEQPK